MLHPRLSGSLIALGRSRVKKASTCMRWRRCVVTGNLKGTPTYSHGQIIIQRAHETETVLHSLLLHTRDDDTKLRTMA
jgi:hypothetical protein